MSQRMVMQTFGEKKAHGWSRVPFIYFEDNIVIPDLSQNATKLITINADNRSRLRVLNQLFADTDFGFFWFIRSQDNLGEVVSFNITTNIFVSVLNVTAIRNGTVGANGINFGIFMIPVNGEKMVW